MSTLGYPSLLLLPSPPIPATRSAWKAAYLPSLTAAILSLRDLKQSVPIVLEVLVACPQLRDRVGLPRSQIYQETQDILSGIYSLICLICAQHSIESDGLGGIDPRIILAIYDSSQHVSHDSAPPSGSLITAGPIIDLFTFALTRRRWAHVYSVDGEDGEDFFKRFMTFVRLLHLPFLGKIHSVSGGISMVSNSGEDNTQRAESLGAVHTTVAVGGTFDHLHAGHKLLLTATALLLQPSSSPEDAHRRLIVGITGDELLKNKKYAEQLQSWDQRQTDVLEFLKSILYFRKGEKDIETTLFNEPGPNGRAVHTHLKQARITIECVEIQDPFGPTITDASISALVVSGETRSGGALVNEKREEKGWMPLEVFEINVLDSQFEEGSPSAGEDFASKISSTAIRKRRSEAAKVSS